MKSITKQLLDASKGLLVKSPEVSGEDYEMFNDGSVECEVGELLYSFVRILKPKQILETGTYKGVSSAYMALALKENGKGWLDTLEIEQTHIDTSWQLWKKVGVADVIACFNTPSLSFERTAKYDMLFLDSEPNLRFHELVKFYPNLSEGGYLFIHDLPRTYCQGNFNSDHPEIKSYPYGDVPIEMANLLKERKLVPFNFPNPRGMGGFYKPTKEDYFPQ